MASGAALAAHQRVGRTLEMWIFRYVRELGIWAFTRWRVHQAVVGALLIVGGLVGVSRFSVQPQAIGGYLLFWLVVLTFVIAPARLWHEQDQRLQPGVLFVDHEDDGAVDSNTGVQYARVTVKNRGASLLTGVELVLASIEPRPADFMTLHVPLQPMHAPPQDSRFSLQPEMHRTVNLFSLDINSPVADIWHVVDAVPRSLPLGEYRLLLIVSTNERPPIEQWFSVKMSRGDRSQTLSVVRET